MEKNRYDCALKVIEANDSIIIHRHSNPDGDALGSQVGLYEIIRENYPEKRVYMVGDESERYGFISERAMDEVDDSLFCSSLSIILDTSSPALISDDRWRSAKDSLRFDHHLFIEKIADYEVVDSTYESSCGLIADFAKILGLKVNDKAAKALYTGMVTDSGRFLYDSVSSRTHTIAAFLLERNFDRNDIFRNLYVEDLESVKRKLSFMERIKFTYNNVAYVYSTKEDVAKMGVSPFSVSRGMVNTMANLKGVHVWVNFTEDGDKVLCELRSDSYDINKIAKKYGGGGHLKASGATLCSRKEAESMLKDLDSLVEDDNE